MGFDTRETTGTSIYRVRCPVCASLGPMSASQDGAEAMAELYGWSKDKGACIVCSRLLEKLPKVAKQAIEDQKKSDRAGKKKGGPSDAHSPT